ncbi:MAG: PTS sugar transporter subunit IIA, partial [Bacillota bacterium]|nr:PTS sugar transporter subunit IIA [Bacillota bacterium]
AAGRAEAIRELAGRLLADGRLDDVEGFTRDVLAREAEVSTSMGHGIAIPHAKSAHVRRAGLAFGRSARGIEWPGFDGGVDRVTQLFLIAVPRGADDKHLRILAALARSLMDPGFRLRLAGAATAGALAELLRERLAAT